MGFPTRYFLRDNSDCGKSYTRNATFILGGALGLRLCRRLRRRFPSSRSRTLPLRSCSRLLSLCPCCPHATSLPLCLAASQSAWQSPCVGSPCFAAPRPSSACFCGFALAPAPAWSLPCTRLFSWCLRMSASVTVTLPPEWALRCPSDAARALRVTVGCATGTATNTTCPCLNSRGTSLVLAGTPRPCLTRMVSAVCRARRSLRWVPPLSCPVLGGSACLFVLPLLPRFSCPVLGGSARLFAPLLLPRPSLACSLPRVPAGVRSLWRPPPLQ